MFPGHIFHCACLQSQKVGASEFVQNGCCCILVCWFRVDKIINVIAYVHFMLSGIDALERGIGLVHFTCLIKLLWHCLAA